MSEIQKMIEQALPGAQVMVQDLVGDGDHLQAVVISDLFQGKRLLQQHQMVYAALKDTLQEKLHALALKTFTTEQWNQQK
ncbi:MAG: BolA family transcriptional regulator [Deltaproteobacteria bacterium]|nr:BolA family transcriptional regulator [Deltaproteobacteria bacterium]